MEKKTPTEFITLLVAIFAFATAIITQWDKIFPPEPDNTDIKVREPNIIGINGNNNDNNNVVIGNNNNINLVKPEKKINQYVKEESIRTIEEMQNFKDFIQKNDKRIVYIDILVSWEVNEKIEKSPETTVILVPNNGKIEDIDCANAIISKEALVYSTYLSSKQNTTAEDVPLALGRFKAKTGLSGDFGPEQPYCFCSDIYTIQDPKFCTLISEVALAWKGYFLVEEVNYRDKKWYSTTYFTLRAIDKTKVLLEK